MIQFLIFALFSGKLLSAPNICPYPLIWELKKVGTLISKDLGGATDFIFLNDNEILVANFPGKGKQQAPLQIYNKTIRGWEYNSAASSKLPETFHPRQMILEDLDGDKIKEVVIADHGTDQPPFPGSHPFILKKKNGQWRFDPSSKLLGSDFTFNVAVLQTKDGKKALYKANVSGKTPYFYGPDKKTKWQDITSSLPKELGPNQLCFMTALSSDFDNDGVTDLFLGGCDRPEKMQAQTHDRILSLQNGKWELQPPVAIPARQIDSQWGTVFVTKININTDNKTDLLIATHDFGFHFWKVSILENHSLPGKFIFKEINLPLKQESGTEGYVNSLEELKVAGYGIGIFAEVRSVIRNPKMKLPSKATRFVLKDENSFEDASECLPEALKKSTYLMKKYPNDPERMLLVPNVGDIFSLKVSKKK